VGIRRLVPVRGEPREKAGLAMADVMVSCVRCNARAALTIAIVERDGRSVVEEVVERCPRCGAIAA
jgi:hypothetical protein